MTISSTLENKFIYPFQSNQVTQKISFKKADFSKMNWRVRLKLYPININVRRYESYGSLHRIPGFVFQFT